MGKNKGPARGSEEPVPALDPEHSCAGGVNGDDKPHFPSNKIYTPFYRMSTQ